MLIRGMDVSSYPEMKDRGYHYYNEQGKEVDVLEYAVTRGFNYARLRIWNNPADIPESGGYCDLEQTIRMAKKIKEQRIGFLLDFHYSDWWADPGNQHKPIAWEHFSVEELETAVYEYTKSCLCALKAAGVYPDMVQIGNEIRTGMLFPEGAVPHWNNLARFINAGIRAVRETQGTYPIKIMLHLDQGGMHAYFKEWFDRVMDCGVTDFDIIGLSYYPFWHGTFSEFKKNMDALVERYGRELVVAETAHAFRKSSGFFNEEQERAAGFPASQAAQRQVLELIIQIIAGVKEKKALGFFYWEPFMRALEESSGWGTCMGLMDENGKPTEGYQAIGYVPTAEKGRQIAKVYGTEKLVLYTEGTLCEEMVKQKLPTTLQVLYADGTTDEKQVVWKMPKLEKEQKLTLVGCLMDVPKLWQNIEKQLYICNRNENLLKNGHFDKKLEGYTVACRENAVSYGVNENGFWYQATENFSLELKTQVQVTTGENYEAELSYRGGNTTGTEITFFVSDGEREITTKVFPETDVWNSYHIAFLEASHRMMTVGVRIEAPPVTGEIKEIYVWET